MVITGNYNYDMLTFMHPTIHQLVHSAQSRLSMH